MSEVYAWLFALALNCFKNHLVNMLANLSKKKKINVINAELQLYIYDFFNCLCTHEKSATFRFCQNLNPSTFIFILMVFFLLNISDDLGVGIASMQTLTKAVNRV